MKKDAFGVWEITLPAVNGQPAIPHNSKIKVRPAATYTILFVLPLTQCL